MRVLRVNVSKQEFDGPFAHLRFPPLIARVDFRPAELRAIGVRASPADEKEDGVTKALLVTIAREKAAAAFRVCEYGQPEYADAQCVCTLNMYWRGVGDRAKKAKNHGFEWDPGWEVEVELTRGGEPSARVNVYEHEGGGNDV